MLVLPPELTHVQASACLELMQATAASEPDGQPLEVDVGGLEHFDSSALAVLLSLRRMAVRQGRGFAVRGLSGRLQELARLYGVLDLLLQPACDAAETDVSSPQVKENP